MTDFNAHLSIASFAMAGLLIISVAFAIPRQEILLIFVAIVSYVVTALVFAYIKEKRR